MLTASHVAIFSRPPIPGEVKTQLIPMLGADGAAALYQRLLRRTLYTVCNTGCPRSLWIAGDSSHPMLHAVSREFAIALRKQRGANLSARMKHAMRTMLVETDAVAIVGADCPILDAHHLEQMFAALRDGAEVAAIPAEDGGYVAIGVSNAERTRLNAVLDALFDNMPWGTAQVMACTRERLRWISAECHEQPALWDVDRAKDLERLESIANEADERGL
ncbi:TIGR04282 family arsenosugar biosynthesis glycosyltransferase [Burkholderia cenocepacia]|uniref:TIGR04282 family arsenosugar biosynthesis glycosyltransferase n=1 Tax=Burkholderia cenocepacia TaxID=95486 RepID=UPI000846D2EA|nr:TIGR04282 family arsenosugar biosynthesis glycosyltransferase [Burkholderia cenocepacia]